MVKMSQNRVRPPLAKLSIGKWILIDKITAPKSEDKTFNEKIGPLSTTESVNDFHKFKG